MLECRDIDALMMEFLYQELQRDQEGDFDAHLDGCARCQSEVASFQHTREAVSILPEIDPPSSLTAILLHEAAKQAPAPARAAVALPDDAAEPGGILGWLSRLFSPIALHPAATAIATLVLVAGVAGSFYIRGDHRVTTHLADSERAAPTIVEAEISEGMVRMPDNRNAQAVRPNEPAAAGQAGYGASLDDSLDDESTGRLARRDPNSLALGNGPVDTATLNARGGEAELKQELSANKNGLRMSKRASKARRAANAVSGADMLVDIAGEDDGEFRAKPSKKARKLKAKPQSKTTGRSGGVKRDQAQPPPPPRSPSPEPVVVRSQTSTSAKDKTGRYRVYKNEDAKEKAAKGKKGESDRRWAASRQRELDNAVRLKRCRAAAKIANDILDRTPDYYYQRVDGSTSVKTCSGFVSAERSRRSKSRAKRRAAKKSKGGASSSGKAQAAPAADESVSH